MGNANDRQVGGDHYRSLAIQPWDALRAWLTPEEFSGFLKGTAIVYLARTKNRSEDVAKAHHTLEKLLEVLNGRYLDAKQRAFLAKINGEPEERPA